MSSTDTGGVVDPSAAADRPELTTLTTSVQPTSLSADDLLANARPTRLPYMDRKNEHKLKQRIEEHGLRKTIAKWSYIALAVQILIADTVFVIYAGKGRHWNLPVAAISVWLSATVVQVIAVLLVITRYLFPDRGRR